MTKQFNVHMLAFEKGKIREVNVPCEELTGKLGQDLDLIFRYGQNDFQPQPICSVSVGDVAEFDGEPYMVMSSGWKKMSKQEFKQYSSMASCPACGKGVNGVDPLCEFHYEEYLGQHCGSHNDIPDCGDTVYTPNHFIRFIQNFENKGNLILD